MDASKLIAKNVMWLWIVPKQCAVIPKNIMCANRDGEILRQIQRQSLLHSRILGIENICAKFVEKRTRSPAICGNIYDFTKVS